MTTKHKALILASLTMVASSSVAAEDGPAKVITKDNASLKAINYHDR